MARHYVTTAIDYPNAAPHMGHVLEKVLADVAARWFRLKGDDVRFQTGTDEHGIKIQQTAAKQGMTPRELVDKNVPLFEDLYKRLHICADMFVRTSDGPIDWPNKDAFHHRPTVEALWKKLQAAGMLEKRTYTGLYCVGCERFLTKKDLVEGKCAIHQKEPEEVKEENWFFLLSKETEWLKKLLKEHYTIIPEFRAHEMLNLLEGGLEDVSFSRPKSSLEWGIPVPGDEEQTMYVWCDALTNYISGLGYFTDREQKQWWEDATATHVIGKDIARFHALIWPAMLKHAGIPAPKQLLIHGFLTSEGQKMSKSLGNVVVPDDVLSKYGVDAMRFYLMHQIPVGNDGDFSWSRFADIYGGVLAAQFGNLLNRVMILLKKEGGSIGSVTANAVPELSERIGADWKHYSLVMDEMRLDQGVAIAAGVADLCNKMMQKYEPWKKAGEEKLAILSAFAEAIRHLSLMLLPFIPETAQKMSMQLGVPYAGEMVHKHFVLTEDMKAWGGIKEWVTVGEPQILFPPVENAEK